MPLQEVDIKIKAVDQASSVFSRVGQAAHKMNMEARAGGEKDIERLLKGGGAFALATFAVEAIAKAAKDLQETMSGVASGTLSAGQAFENLAGAVPILGRVWEAGRGLRDAIQDMQAYAAKAKGESDETVQSLKSDTTVLAEYKAGLQAANKDLEDMVKLRRSLATVGLVGTDKDRQNANNAYEDEMARARQSKEEERRSIDKQTRDNADKIFDEKEKLASALRKKSLAEADKKDKDDSLKREFDHEKKLGEIRFESQQENLRILKEDFSAEIDAIQHKYEIEIATAEEAARILRESIPQGVKSRADEIKKIDSDLADFESSLAARRDGEAQVSALQEAERLRAKQQIYEHYEQEISSAMSSARQSQYEQEGRSIDASLEQIKNNYNRRIELIDQDLARDIHEHPGDSGDLNKEADRRKEAAYEEAHAEREKIRLENARREADLNYKTQSETDKSHIRSLQMDAEAGDAAKRIEADRLEIQNKYNDQIQQMVLAKQTASKYEKKLIDDQLKSVHLEWERANALQKTREADEARQNHENAMRSLADERIGLLQLEANHGNAAAKIEADRLEIQNKYVEQQERLLQLIKQTTSETDKQKLKEQLGRLEKEKAAELALAGLSTTAPKYTAQMESGEGGTGTYDYLREQQAAARAEYQKQSLDALNAIVKNTDPAAPGGPGGNPGGGLPGDTKWFSGPNGFDPFDGRRLPPSSPGGGSGSNDSGSHKQTADAVAGLAGALRPFTENATQIITMLQQIVTNTNDDDSGSILDFAE